MLFGKMEAITPAYDLKDKQKMGEKIFWFNKIILPEENHT